MTIASKGAMKVMRMMTNTRRLHGKSNLARANPAIELTTNPPSATVTAETRKVLDIACPKSSLEKMLAKLAMVSSPGKKVRHETGMAY